MKVCGIDVGKNGGYAIITNQRIEVWRMPDIHVLADKLDFENKSGPFHVFIEKAQAFRGQGVTGMFNYGAHFGQLLGLLVAFNIPHTLVPPQTWTKKLHVGTKSVDAKKRSLEACQRLFPGVNLIPEGCRKPHDGIVDALLIAEYGRRMLNGSK